MTSQTVLKASAAIDIWYGMTEHQGCRAIFVPCGISFAMGLRSPAIAAGASLKLVTVLRSQHENESSGTSCSGYGL